ncbi:MAG: sulfur carrier protein ThiS [Stenotrophobium sp.]
MQLAVNGERREIKSAATLIDLIALLDLHGKRLAVERNGEIVPRSQYAQTPLAEDDRIEIVQAIGGG